MRGAGLVVKHSVEREVQHKSTKQPRDSEERVNRETGSGLLVLPATGVRFLPRKATISTQIIIIIITNNNNNSNSNDIIHINDNVDRL